MKFLVVTYGTEGDARPLAILCRALMDAGHDARWLAYGATLGTAHALGVPAAALAGRPVPARRPTEARLAEGIGFAERPETRARASALGASMRAEDGPATAVAAIEALMRQGPGRLPSPR